MAIANTCKRFCAELRKMGFTHDPMRRPYIIPEEALLRVARLSEWATITRMRYLGVTGYLVEFGYLEVTEDGEFVLTGADIDA